MKITLLSIAASLTSISSSQAVVISNFDFTGAPWPGAKEADFATFSAAASSVDSEANTTTSDLFKTANIDAGGYASYYIRDSDGAGAGFGIFTNSVTAGVGMNFADVEEAVATNYISFNVTTTAGFITTFENLTLFLGTNSGNMEFELRSHDGTTETSLASHSFVDPNPGGGANANDPVVAHDFDFTDFTAPGTIEFRLYAWGGASASTGARLDDIILNGTVVSVPEPSSIALLGLGGLALIIRRR